MKDFLSNKLPYIGVGLSFIVFGLLAYDNNLKNQNVKLLVSQLSETKEHSYETGCNNGSYQSCQLLQDMKDRYEECLKSALVNCKTWAMVYRDEPIIATVSKKEKKEQKNERL